MDKNGRFRHHKHENILTVVIFILPFTIINLVKADLKDIPTDSEASVTELVTIECKILYVLSFTDISMTGLMLVSIFR